MTTQELCSYENIPYLCTTSHDDDRLRQVGLLYGCQADQPARDGRDRMPSVITVRIHAPIFARQNTNDQALLALFDLIPTP